MADQKIIRIPKTDKYVAFSSCHRIPERSFSWKGQPLLCYRCLGIDLGFVITAFFLFMSLFIPQLNPLLLLELVIPGQLRYFFLLSILLQLPFIIDGLIQAFTRYESNNSLRLVTGFIGGVGQFYLLISIGALISLVISWF